MYHLHSLRESYQSGYMPSGNASTLGYLTTSAADITQNSLVGLQLVETK